MRAAPNSNPRLLALSCALLAAPVSLPVHAAWVVSPSATVRAEISDNVQLRTEDIEESGTTSRISAQARLRNVTDTSDISAVLGASYLAYSGVDNLDDRDDQFIELVARKSLERAQLSLQGSLRRDDLLRGTGFIQDGIADSEEEIDQELDEIVDDVDVDVGTVTDQLDRIRAQLTPSVSFQLNQRTSAQIDYSYFEIFYDDSSLAALVGAQETRSQAIGSTVSHRLSEQTTINVRGRATKFEPELSQESDVYEVSVGLTRQLSEISNLEVQLGANRTDPEISDSENGFQARIGYNRRTANGRLRLSVQRRLSPGSFGSILETDEVVVRYRHRFSQRLSGVLAVTGLSSESSNDPFSRQNRDLVQFTPELSWRFNENWTGTGGYRLRWTDRDFDNDDAVSNAAFVSLTYRPQSEIR